MIKENRTFKVALAIRWIWANGTRKEYPDSIRGVHIDKGIWKEAEKETL